MASEMKEAPRDGSRILLHYHIRNYIRNAWRRAGTKWEECRWRFRDLGGFVPHWEPWCGADEIHTTDNIAEVDAIEWLPLPSGRCAKTALLDKTEAKLAECAECGKRRHCTFEVIDGDTFWFCKSCRRR